MTVWDAVVGQPDVVRELRAAATAAHEDQPGPGMTHTWLVTGPPGSGRSIAAMALATALVCPNGGCGACEACHAAAAGAHPDIEQLRSTTLSLGKDRTRALVARAAGAPATARWRCFVIEDADRMTEAAANTLLKAIEEPTARTVWILCAPSPEDLLPTIRSRTRQVALRIPASADVADVLIGEGVDPAMAAFAAHASQGHIGRARALATDDEARARRSMVLRIPRSLGTISDAYAVAHDLRKIAEADAKVRSTNLDAAETEELLTAYGQGADGVSNAKVRTLAGRALADLNKQQSQRSSRSVRDELDRYFVDLLGYYRDVLLTTLRVEADLVNPDVRPAVEQDANTQSAGTTLARIDALAAARSHLEGNVPPALVCEALLVQLLHPVPLSP